MIGLQDKVAIVTGSSDGIGRVIALKLASEGAKVVINGRSPEKGEAVVNQIRETGGDAFSLALHGGEDYQMLMAVPPERVDALREVAGVWSVTLSVVGQFAPGAPGLSLRFGEAMRKLRPKSHDHFAGRERRREPAPEA